MPVHVQGPEGSLVGERQRGPPRVRRLRTDAWVGTVISPIPRRDAPIMSPGGGGGDGGAATILFPFRGGGGGQPRRLGRALCAAPHFVSHGVGQSSGDAGPPLMKGVWHPGSQAQSCRTEGTPPQVPQVRAAGRRCVIAGPLNGAPLPALPPGKRVGSLSEVVSVTDNRPLPICPGHRLVDVSVTWWEPHLSQPELHKAERGVRMSR